jgi:hypothetical protein
MILTGEVMIKSQEAEKEDKTQFHLRVRMGGPDMKDF